MERNVIGVDTYVATDVSTVSFSPTESDSATSSEQLVEIHHCHKCSMLMHIFPSLYLRDGLFFDAFRCRPVGHVDMRHKPGAFHPPWHKFFTLDCYFFNGSTWCCQRNQPLGLSRTIWASAYP